MKIHAKVGTGPGRIIIVDGRKWPKVVKEFREKGSAYFKYKNTGHGERWQGGLLDGWTALPLIARF